jgi:hypothetical protein
MSRQATRSIFGQKIATFRGRSIGFRTWIFVIIPGSLLTLFSFIYGMFLAGNIYQQHGPALAYIRARSWIIFGTILLIVLVAYFIYRILISLQRIEVFNKGIRYRTRTFRNRSYRWSDLSGITSSATQSSIFGKNFNTNPGGRIYPNSGKPIELTNRFQDVPRLIKIVKSNIYPLIWPQLKSIFRRGGSTEFGRITVSKEQVQISNKVIPWTSVNRVRVDSGFLVVELRRDSNRRVPISNIPNLELLLQVIEWGFQT